jgi:hypothetical protein
MAARRDDDEGERYPGPFDDAPRWVRLGLQILVALVVLSVWALSTSERVLKGEPPDPLTFGLVGLVVLLVYGRNVQRWWRK